MSETATEAPATETTDTEQPQPKPTETVDFWKQKAREQEKRAKENATAAQRLAEIEDAQKTEAQKAADRLREAEERAQALELRVTVAEVASSSGVPVEILTGPAERTAEGIKAYADQLSKWAGERTKPGNRVPREGTSSAPSEGAERETARALFGG